MAELLNQAEIDALLNSNVGGQESAEAAPSGAAEPGKPSGRTKKFYHRENKNERFRFSYHSPVVKRSRILMNPDPRQAPPADRIVVRSLDNYMEHLRSKHTSVAAQ